MLYLKEPLAKPTGVTYNEHVQNVVDQSENYISCHDFVIAQYKQRTGKDLGNWLRKAVKYHDLGKKSKRWQEACQKDYEIYKSLAKNSKFTAKHLQQLGREKIRHELIPLKALHDKLELGDEVLAAIAAHHGKLSSKEEERFKNSNAIEYWDKFKRLNGKFSMGESKEQSLNESLDLNYRFSGLRYLLQLADHRASAAEPPSNTNLPDFKTFDYDFPHTNKRKVQQIAEENWNESLLLLRAPTGGGKTDASLLWAKKQIDNGKADRLVICMPTRFTSNALEIAVASQLSATGLYHSSAWFSKHFKQAKKNKAEKNEERQKFSFARTLEVPVTVCTIDHLLLSLTQSREDHHGILFNLAHSCVVIDEADFYDDFTQANIQVLLKVLRHFQRPALIMSATLPESALTVYEKAGYGNLSIKEDTSGADLIRCEIKECVSYSDPDDLSILLEQCMKQPSIIYANTVDKAYQFYEWFQIKGFKNVTLYHSRFTEPDKESKEAELIGKLGKEAWKAGKANGVAILTQIGELSINISADLMLTDIAPGDRLVQRLGRLSRFKDEYGIVYLLLPQKDGALYPAPYGDFIKRKWIPSNYLMQTQKIFAPGKYKASDFVDLVNAIYPIKPEPSNLAKANSELLYDYLPSRWLMLPADQPKADDEGTTFWKSRNIKPTIEVITEEIPDQFNTYETLMEFKICHSVALPSYIVTKGVKDHIISKQTVHVGDVEHELYFDAARNYNSGKGFIIEKPDFEDQWL